MLFGAESYSNSVLGDLGLARQCATPFSCQTVVGSPMYRAPEVWLAGSRDHLGYGLPVDLWAFGLLLYTVFSGLLPFDEDTLAVDIQSAKIDFTDGTITIHDKRGQLHSSAAGHPCVSLLDFPAGVHENVANALIDCCCSFLRGRAGYFKKACRYDCARLISEYTPVN